MYLHHQGSSHRHPSTNNNQLSEQISTLGKTITIELPVLHYNTYRKCKQQDEHNREYEFSWTIKHFFKISRLYWQENYVYANRVWIFNTGLFNMVWTSDYWEILKHPLNVLKTPTQVSGPGGNYSTYSKNVHLASP